MRFASLAFFLLCIASLGAAQSSAQASTQSSTQSSPQAAPQIAWSYHGKTAPSFWSRLNPAYSVCSRGRQQSPVDIRNARLNTALTPVEFHYIGGPVTLANTGSTVRVTVDPYSYIVAGGVHYDLLYYEFHHPSEHTVHGRLFDMELDMVHRSAAGKYAILAVLLSEDRDFPNATLATLWQHLPAKPGEIEKITDMVNAGGLLPSDRGYWTYTGSLAEPPCTEGVQWYVFEQPVSISREQYDAFSALYKMNSRPTQDLNGRKIEANE